MRNLLLCLAAACLAAGCSGAQVLGSLTSGGGAEIATNVIYNVEHSLRLDIFTPENAHGAPVVVFFYGGRWSEGLKEDYSFAGKALAAQGFVVMVPDYRKYPEVRFPAFVQDGADAVKWARDNAAHYGGDPAKLFVMGHSSGAHIAAMLALNEEYLKAVGGSRSWLKGMVGLAGPYDFMPITAPDLREIFGPPEVFEKSQPIFYVDGQNPPLLLVHGEDDEDVWIKNTRNLAAAVNRAGGPAESVIYPSLEHRCAVAALSAISAPLCGRPDVMLQVADFIRRMSHAHLAPADVGGVQTEPLPSDKALPGPGAALPAPPAPPQPVQTRPEDLTLPEPPDSSAPQPVPAP